MSLDQTHKADFPMLVAQPEWSYLDSTASTLTPQSVIDAICKYHSQYRANVHRGAYKASGQATDAYEQARDQVAQFIGAKTGEIVFTMGTTHGLNMIAHCMSSDLGPGDKVVVSRMEHHANLLPWQQLAKVKGFELAFIELDDDHQIDLESAHEQITPNTKVVSIAHVSNVLGTIAPVKEIVALAKNVDAKVVLDAAQSVPHMVIDVTKLGVDALAFSGHKMCGPTGIGVVWARQEFLTQWSPYMVGGGMIRRVTDEDATWEDAPAKFEPGTPNISGAIGLGAAVEYLKSIGMNAIHAHEQALTQYFVAKLKEIPRVTIVGPVTGSRAGVVSFTLDGVHPHDAATALNAQGIAVRTGHHCAQPLMRKLGITGTIRASLYLYTSKEDIDRLVAGVTSILTPDSTHADIGEMDTVYREMILDLYANPRNKMVMEDADVHSELDNPSCGDEITMYLKITDDKVSAATFTGTGCAISEAASSLLTDHLIGKTADEVLQMNKQTIDDLFGFSIIDLRSKCAIIGLRSAQHALKQYGTTD